MMDGYISDDICYILTKCSKVMSPLLNNTASLYFVRWCSDELWSVDIGR